MCQTYLFSIYKNVLKTAKRTTAVWTVYQSLCLHSALPAYPSWLQNSPNCPSVKRHIRLLVCVGMCVYMCVCALCNLYKFVMIALNKKGVSQKNLGFIKKIDMHVINESVIIIYYTIIYICIHCCYTYFMGQQICA